MLFDFNIRLQIKREIAKADNKKPKHIAWMYSCLYPMVLMYKEFLSYRKKTLLTLSYNGQTMMLEYALNNTYPDANGLIYIENVSLNLEDSYLYFLSETEEGFDYYLSENKNEFDSYLSEGNLSYDFIVYYPNTYVPNITNIKAFVKKYCEAGRRFIIKSYIA